MKFSLLREYLMALDRFTYRKKNLRNETLRVYKDIGITNTMLSTFLRQRFNSFTVFMFLFIIREKQRN